MALVFGSIVPGVAIVAAFSVPYLVAFATRHGWLSFLEGKALT
jgi:hypothetical protein